MCGHFGLEERLGIYNSTPDPLLAAVVALFPGSVSRRQEYWLSRLDAAVAQESARTNPEPVRVSTRPLPEWWIEKPLPTATLPWQSGDGKQEPPPDAQLPVPRDAVLRYEEVNGERAIVYLSNEYGFLHERPATSLWFAKTTRGVWDRALYLGLQQNFGYVVTPASRLPMVDGERLRLEVRIRESEYVRNGFRMFRTGLKRSVDGMYLEFNLATLAADRDGDGLTDVAERRLGLDFARADTDGDGVADGQDPLPLVRYRRMNSATDRLARVLLSKTFGLKPRSMLVGVAPRLEQVRASFRSSGAPAPSTQAQLLVSDPELFAGVATPFQLFVYSRADIEAMNQRDWPSPAGYVPYVFSSLDRTQHYVPSLNGRSVFITCQGLNDDACRVWAEESGVY